MKFILKYRIPIIIAGVLLTVFMALFISKLDKNTGMESMLDKNNPDYKYFEEIEDIFGSMETITIGISTEKTVYDKNVLKAIGELSDFFKNRQEIDEDDVLSITTVDNMISENKELIVNPLIEDYNNITDEEIINLKKQIDENPLLNDKIVSKDDKSSIINANVLGGIIMDEKKSTVLMKEVYAKIKEIKNKYPETKFYISGFATAEVKISEYMTKDIFKLTPLALLIVMLILLITLKEFRTMILPILVTIISIIWTLSLKAIFKVPLTIAEITVPVMLISICCAYGIHIIHEHQLFLKNGMSSKEAITKTIKILFIPTLLSALTTAIGFLSLVTAPGVSIRNMGIFLSIGVIVAMFYSLIFIPVILSFYNKRKEKKEHLTKFRTKFGGMMDKFLDITGNFVVKFKYFIMTAAIFIAILTVFSIFNIKFDTDPISYFHKKDEFRIGTEHINKTMGGISDLYIIFDSNEENLMKEPEVLKKMWDLQKYAESITTVSYTFSIADYIRHINYLLNDSNESYRRLPGQKEIIDMEKYQYVNGKEIITYEKKEVQGKEQVANLLLLYEMGGGDVLDSLVNSDYSKACMHVIINETSTNSLRKIIKQLDKYILENINIDNMQVKYTNHYVRLKTTDLIVQSQVNSIISTLLAVIVLLIIIYRSFIYGILTSIPTFIAIMCNFTVMWLAKVPLDAGTSIIASIGIGVGIDYAIHFFQRFKNDFLINQNYEIAVRQAIKDCSRSIFSNAIAVGLGFLVLTLSSFRLVVDLGWIIALSMITTSIAAIVVLPAFILIFKPKLKIKNNLLQGEKK